MINRLVALGVLLPLSGAPATAAADDDPFAEVRAEFVLAYAASRTIDSPTTERDSVALQAYALYPYLQAARIRRALNTAAGGWAQADQNALELLEIYSAEPVGSTLRRDWLISLARREQWRTFLQHYRSSRSDPILHCHYLSARIALDEIAGLAPAIAEQWLTPHQLPIECEPPFQWLRAEGPLTDDLIEQRVRLLLENDQASFARIISRRLPKERTAPLLHWADLIQSPRSTIDALIAAPDQEVEEKALLAGWSRLARNAPVEALERYDRLVAARNLDQSQISAHALALALGLAWDRRPEALQFFVRVAADDLDDYALGWQSRAALWVENWTLVDNTIAAMSAEQRETSRWRYWAARSAEQTRNRRLASEIYASVLVDDNYYSAMAAARLGQRAQPHAEPLARDPSRQLELASRPPLLRARELFLSGLASAAMREWRHGLNPLDDDAQVQSIHLAFEWQRYDLVVATATRHDLFNDYALLYPRPYQAEVRDAASFVNLDEPLIYGVIRQESLYRTDAASTSGSLGLMQLQPATAREIARPLNRSTPSRADLFDPAQNITLGATQLRSLLDRLDGNLVVALAGYNAGANTAQRWLPDKPTDADIWIENIPYNETRTYVRRVLWHSLVFAWLQDGRAQNTSTWIDSVEPEQLQRQ